MSSRKLQRAQRRWEQQEQRLVIRHRWYAGGVATLLSAALVLTGMTPAVADEILAPDPAAVQSVDTPKSDVPEPAPTEDKPDPAPTETKTEVPAPAPVPEEQKSEPQADTKTAEELETLETLETESLETGPQTMSLLEDGPLIGTLSAPSIPQFGAGITVNLRALRAAAGGQTPTSATAGIQMQLRNNVNGGSGTDTYSAPGDTVIATCTTDADGDCNFVLPTAYLGVQYWVVPVSASGPNAFLSQYLVTGNNTDSTSNADRFAANPYVFRTPVITASQNAYQLPATGTTNLPTRSRVGNPTPPPSRTVGTANRWNHYGGDMIVTSVNPRYMPTCTPGVKVALIIDTSTSMTTNNNEGLDGAKDAATAFANAFVDKGVQLGIYRFGTSVPAAVLNPTTVTSGNISSINTTINNISISGTQYTNWDWGIYQIQNQGFDIAVVLTDGNPTRYGRTSSTVAGNDAWTDLRGVEEAALSANLLKAQGTQILAFGVGAYLNAQTPQNLAAVTGKVQWTQGGGTQIGNADFAIPSSWNVVATQLGALASKLTCEATITVKKVEKPHAAADRPGQNWQFTTTKTGQDGTLTPTTSQTTGPSGTVTWNVAFTGLAHTTTATIKEDTTKPGWSFVGAECRQNGVLVPGVTVSGTTVTLPSFGVGADIECTFTNQEAPPNVELTVKKNATPKFDRDYDWTISKAVSRTSATVLPGQTAEFVYTVTATPSAPKDTNYRVDGFITVTNPNNVAVAVAVTDTLPGATCTVTNPNRTIPAGGEDEFAYSCAYPGTQKPADATNTARATWTLAGTSGAANGTAPVAFTNPTTVTDGSVLVTDTAPEFEDAYPTAAARTAHAPAGEVFTYKRNLTAPAGQCVDYPNTASLTGIGQQTAPLSDDAEVKVCAPVGTITIAKALVGTPAGFAGVFEGEWFCSAQGQTPITGTWTVNTAGTAELTPASPQIPVGWSCTVSETTPSDDLFTDPSYSWASKNASPSSATVAAGTPASFTVTNTAQRSSLKLVKSVTNPNGGTLSGDDWDGKLHAGALTYLNEETKFVGSGTYVLSEDAVDGYTAGNPAITCTDGTLSGSTVTVAKGKAVVCTFHNVDIAPKLTLKKVVDNKNGIGTRSSTEWTLSATGTNGFSEAASQNVTADSSTTTTHTVRANTAYTLGESNIDGYAPGDWSCTGGSLTGSQLELDPGDDVTCTITNTVKTHTVKLKKEWTNALTGAAAELTITAGQRSDDATSTVGATASFTDNTNVAELEVAEGSTVNLAEVVSGPGSYATALVCTQGVTPTKIENSDRNQSIVVPAADVVCTYQNTANSVNVSLTKKWADNSFDSDQVNLFIKSGNTVLAQATSDPTDTPDVTVTTSVRVGDKVTLSEFFGSTNTGQYNTSWECTGVTAPAADAVTTGEITVPAGGVSCTVTNTPKLVTVTVDKKWVGAHVGDDANFTVNGSPATPGTSNADAPTETDAGVVVQQVRYGDTISIVETLAAGNTGVYNSSFKCGTADFAPGRTISLVEIKANTTCVFQNERDTQKVTLVKKWVDAFQGDEATLTLNDETPKASTANGSATFVDTANQIIDTVPVGATINLSELLDTANNTGSYDTTFACDDGIVGGSGLSRTLTVQNADVTCTFTNTAKKVDVSLTKNWVDSFTGDKADLKINIDASPVKTGTSTAPTATTITQQVRLGDVVSFEETFPAQGNTGAYQPTWECSDTGAPQDGALASAQFVVTGATSCTITNTAKKVTVTVDKQWVNAFVGDDASITVNAKNGSSDAGTANETDSAVVTETVRIGDAVAISESLAVGNTGLYDSEYSCGGDFAEGTGIPSFLATADVTCVFKNTARTHSVTLEKQWVNAIQGDKATLSINGGAGVVSTANGNAGSWLDPAKATATVRAGDQVDFAETLEALSGSTYTSTYSCTPSGGVAGEGVAFGILEMPDADVVCTFTNSNVRGKLTLEKHVSNDDGGDAADTAWTLNAAGIVSISGTEGQAAVTNAFVPVGSYTLTETNGPDGYTFTGILCTVNGGEPFALVKNDAGQYVIPVAVQQDIVCEFQNDDIAPTLTLKKHVVNTGGGIQPATEWTLTAAESGQPAVISEKGASTDGGASAVTQTATVEAGVGYQLSESFIAGYTQGTWSCGQADVTPGGVVTLDLDENVTCEITNTAIPATGSHVKTVKSLSQAADGTWTIVYTVVVTNTSAASTLTYDLGDTLRFGSGIQVVDASWTGPNNAIPVPFASEWSTTLADDVQLTKAVGSHTYEVTARATIASFPSAGDTWQDCVLQPGENGTGFLNTSALTIGDSTVVKSACDQPEFPGVVKTGLTSTQNPVTGAWTISYRIDVTATGGAGDPAVATTVRDVLPGAPEDWALVGTWSVTNAAGTPAVDLSLAPGSRTIWTGFMPAGATYSYTVTGVLQPSPEAEAIGPCVDEAGGLINTAIVTSGAASASDDGCAATDAATVTVEKAATSVSQNADGTWLVTYLVSVTNDSDELTAIYDLTDAPLFGADATAGPVRWAPSNAAGELLGALSSATPLANDKPLAASGVDYYLVQITADIAADAWTGDEDGVLGLPCPTGWERGAETGGLLNGAYTTSGDQDDQSFGCIEPKLPTILKAPVSAVQLEDPSQWAVTYTLTVTGKGTDTFYDLADVPDFVDGVNIVGPGSATRVGSGSGPLAIPVPAGPASVPFVTDVALGGSETHVWRVTWVVDIPTQILPPELRECGDQGGGFDNRAILTVDDVIQTSDACLPIDEKVYPDMEKTVTGLSRNPETRVWEIRYQIDVTLTDDEQLNPKGLSSEYTLFEELDYPNIIDIVDASWSGYDSGGFAGGATSAYLAQDEPIAAGATHSYIVTVHATLGTGVISQSNVTVGCDTVGGTRQIGFFNTATLTFDDLAPVVREACTPPVYPTMLKTPGSVTENSDGTQTIEYFVTVTAPTPVLGQPVSNVIYALREVPDALPSLVSLVGNWNAERVGGFTPLPSAATWNGVGDWNLQAIAGFSAADRTAGRLVHTYRVWADVTVAGVPATMPEACDDGGADGIPMWNTVSLAIGEQSITDEACVRVNYDDVEIVKTSTLPVGQTSVQPGDQFDYVLTVTNLGTRDATGVRITDTTINDRLDVLAVTVPGFTFTGGFTGNDVDLTLNEPLGVGESVVVTVRVEFLPQSVPDAEFVEPGDALPVPADPIEVLTNTACVTADADSVSENNCSTWEVPARDLTGVVYTTCQSDAAVLGFFVRTSGNLAGMPVSGSWTTVDAPQVTGHSLTIAPFFAGANGFGREIPWPGVEFTPSGVAIDYPGWRPLQASDYTADGQYIDPFDGLPMTAQDVADKIFNGLILDDSELDYAWRGNTTIVFSVNPEITLNASYPPAAAECFQARATEVQIEKTASVEKTDPGKSFTYTLEVANVSPDTAAESVVVTDAIPADLKITDVSWPGKGDSAAFPNWETCAVTGQNAGGYGGTLECVLFGPLQPVGANSGTSAAPTITLAATVNPASTASVITNVAIVDYHTFGDPSDPGRDSDDAIVTLSALPATGGSTMLPLVMLSFLALLGGATMLVITRRRRGEKQASV